MKFLKKFITFVKESKSFTSGLYPHFETDNQIYIENVLENGEVSIYYLNATMGDVITWFVDKYGRETFQDKFNSEDGHSTKDWDMSDEEIEEVIKNDDKYLKEFCKDNRHEWVKINE